MSNTKLYHSASLEPVRAIGERLEKINDVEGFDKSVNNIKAMITYFEDENKKLRRIIRKYKDLTTILKPVHTFVIIPTTSTFVSLADTEIGLVVIPISIGVAFALTINYKLIYEIVLQKFNEHAKQYERAQQNYKFYR